MSPRTKLPIAGITRAANTQPTRGAPGRRPRPTRLPPVCAGPTVGQGDRAKASHRFRSARPARQRRLQEGSEKTSQSPQRERLWPVCAPLLRARNRPLLTRRRVRIAKTHGNSRRAARLATPDSPVLLSEWSPPPQEFWVAKSAARSSAPAPRLNRGFVSSLRFFYPVVFGEFAVLGKLV